MKSLKNIALKLAGYVALLAVMVAVVSNSTACLFWFHQPEVPQGLKNLK